MMPRTLLFPILFTLFLLASCQGAFAKTVYFHSLDNDIINVSAWPNSNEISERVRMYGVRFPSPKEPLGSDARDFLGRYLRKGQKITIQYVVENTEDGISEVLVQVDAHSINYAMVDEGLAWVDRHTCKSSYCRRWFLVEHNAVLNRKGIWGLELDTPPWQWHH